MSSNDSIIIQTLANAACSFGEKKELKDFSTQDVFCSIARLLNIIAEEEENVSIAPFPSEWPSSMSTRYNLGIQMAKTIEDLGYSSSDIGYQTLIHEDASNTKDLSLIFHFLIDKLPFKSSSNLSSILSKPNKDMHIPAIESTEELPRHRNSHLLQPAKDILSEEAYSSLSEHIYLNRKDYISSSIKKVREKTYVYDLDNESKEMLLNLQSAEEAFEQEMEIKKKREIELKLNLQSLKARFEEITKNAKQTEERISESEKNVDVLKKVNHIFEDNESIAKLMDLIEKRRSKRHVLQRQWEEGIGPLEKENEELVLKLKDLKQKEYLKTSTFNRIKKEIQETEDLIQIKESKVSTKTKEYNEMVIESPRSFYTDRIVDLTSKIDEKSSGINIEIENLKSVQKDINMLSSQLERTFTETEARMFQAAKEEENMISAYKILMKWHGACDDVMQGIRTICKIERNVQDLERKVERERSRNFGKKIERLRNDISLVTKENHQLQENNKKELEDD